MKKNNLFNKVIFNKEVKNNQKAIKECAEMVQNAAVFDVQIINCKDLENLIEIHREAYKAGFTENLGPNMYGMFRCHSIHTMNMHNVFLGGIYGLNTYAAAFWEQYIDEPFGENGFGIKEDYPLYTIILNQYKRHLQSNIRCMGVKAGMKAKELMKAGYKL